MNKGLSVLAGVCCACAFVPCAEAQVVKAARAVQRISALDVLGRRFSAGESVVRQVRSAEKAARLAARPHLPQAAPHLSRKQSAFNIHIASPVLPTKSAELLPVLRRRLLEAPPAVLTEAVEQYEKFFADFVQMRQEVDPILGGSLLDKTNLQKELYPYQLGYYAQLVEGMDLRLRKLRLVLFPEDLALQKAQAYIEFAARKFNRFYVPELVPQAAAVRPYVEGEFRMEYDFQDESPLAAEWRTLPENVRLAVLNDNPEILNRYKQWERDGYFPQGWSVFTYDDVQNLLADINGGQKFELIISDINVPGGGGYYFVNRLRQLDAVTPVIGCSMYPSRNHIKTDNLHAIGFDGYMCGEDMFDTADGFSSWVYYVKNYYYYKNKGNWPR